MGAVATDHVKGLPVSVSVMANKSLIEVVAASSSTVSEAVAPLLKLGAALEGAAIKFDTVRTPLPQQSS